MSDIIAIWCIVVGAAIMLDALRVRPERKRDGGWVNSSRAFYLKDGQAAPYHVWSREEERRRRS